MLKIEGREYGNMGPMVSWTPLSTRGRRGRENEEGKSSLLMLREKRETVPRQTGSHIVCGLIGEVFGFYLCCLILDSSSGEETQHRCVGAWFGSEEDLQQQSSS
mmetsp:Transcript_28043/g.82460  ORF Transcript_28043/g.82460 Transcript_28043/m.82460 type:complete len:104 (+) Transcript_28043:988-1299(+)